VLGIINRPGCFASYVRLPAANLHVVPEQLSDAEAAFAEPLAAACRVVEQGLVQSQPGATQRIAVVGDGRLGLLIAQVLALSAPGRVTHFGRHPCKMRLVSGTAECVLSTADAVQQHAAAFDLVVEASGAAAATGWWLWQQRMPGASVPCMAQWLHCPPPSHLPSVRRCPAATGSASSIRDALKLTKAMGTLV
jgi:threonine dehydrogenase-like Zn-dependent dehydrogenase